MPQKEAPRVTDDYRKGLNTGQTAAEVRELERFLYAPLFAGIFAPNGEMGFRVQHFRENTETVAYIPLVKLKIDKKVDPARLHLLVGIYGGTVHESRDQNTNNGIWVWSTDGNDAVDFARDIKVFHSAHNEYIDLFKKWMRGENIKNQAEALHTGRKGSKSSHEFKDKNAYASQARNPIFLAGVVLSSSTGFSGTDDDLGISLHIVNHSLLDALKTVYGGEHTQIDKRKHMLAFNGTEANTIRSMVAPHLI